MSTLHRINLEDLTMRTTQATTLRGGTNEDATAVLGALPPDSLRTRQSREDEHDEPAPRARDRQRPRPNRTGDQPRLDERETARVVEVPLGETVVIGPDARPSHEADTLEAYENFINLVRDPDADREQLKAAAERFKAATAAQCSAGPVETPTPPPGFVPPEDEAARQGNAFVTAVQEKSEKRIAAVGWAVVLGSFLVPFALSILWYDAAMFVAAMISLTVIAVIGKDVHRALSRTMSAAMRLRLWVVSGLTMAAVVALCSPWVTTGAWYIAVSGGLSYALLKLLIYDARDAIVVVSTVTRTETVEV